MNISWQPYIMSSHSRNRFGHESPQLIEKSFLVCGHHPELGQKVLLKTPDGKEHALLIAPRAAKEIVDALPKLSIPVSDQAVVATVDRDVYNAIPKSDH